MTQNSMTQKKTYRSGRLKGLPVYCDCGKTLEYALDFGRVFSVCPRCTPEVEVSVERLVQKGAAT